MTNLELRLTDLLEQFIDESNEYSSGNWRCSVCHGDTNINNVTDHESWCLVKKSEEVLKEIRK